MERIERLSRRLGFWISQMFWSRQSLSLVYNYFSKRYFPNLIFLYLKLLTFQIDNEKSKQFLLPCYRPIWEASTERHCRKYFYQHCEIFQRASCPVGRHVYDIFMGLIAFFTGLNRWIIFNNPENISVRTIIQRITFEIRNWLISHVSVATMST